MISISEFIGFSDTETVAAFIEEAFISGNLDKESFINDVETHTQNKKLVLTN